MADMLQTQPWISLVFFCFVIFCDGYLIDVTSCKQNELLAIREDAGGRFPCTGTDDNMKWDMYYYINTTYSYWQTIATCSPSDCTNMQENRYVATRDNSSASTLQILRADRDNIGEIIRCSSLSGNQLKFCRLLLYCESTPSNCWMELDRADGRVTGSCVTNKFYFSPWFTPTCLWYQSYEKESVYEKIDGKLDHNTIVDRVTGREYANGTCSSVSTYLRRGYGTYVYKMALSFYTKDLALPVYTLRFAPEQTTPLSPVQTTPLSPVQTPPLSPVQTTPLSPVQTTPLSPVQTTPLSSVQTTPLSPVQTNQQPNGGTTRRTTSTETPSAPEKSTQPAPGDGTGGGGNTADSGDKFTVLYALVGGGIVLIIVTIIVVVLVVWKVRRAATPSDADHLIVVDPTTSSMTTVTSGRRSSDPEQFSQQDGAPNSRDRAQAVRPIPLTVPPSASTPGKDGATNSHNRAQAERPRPPNEPPCASNPDVDGALNSRNRARAVRPIPPNEPPSAFNPGAAYINSSDPPEHIYVNRSSSADSAATPLDAVYLTPVNPSSSTTTTVTSAQDKEGYEILYPPYSRKVQTSTSFKSSR